MIWTTQTHELAVTTCQLTGNVCPALRRMLSALSQAMHSASQATQGDFEVTGQSILDGCHRECPARFFASHDRIRVFCDVPSGAERAELDRVADAIMDPEDHTILVKAPAHVPCALGQAMPLGQPRAPRASDAKVTGLPL